MCKTDNSLLAGVPLSAKNESLVWIGRHFGYDRNMKAPDCVHLHIVYIFTSALNKDISAKIQ